MLMKISSFIFLLFLLVASGEYTKASDQLNYFHSETQAQMHCPSDTVVWLNIPSGIYHFKGQHWYGATKSGTYVCKQEADQAGDRVTHNGQ